MFTIDNIRENIVGIDKTFKLLNGKESQYIFMDNGASTPSFRYTLDKVNELMEFYSAVHRGNGFKSFIASSAYEQSHDIISKFVGANLEEYSCVFVKNTTEAINKLSYRFCFGTDDVVLTTGMEHHSNLLPWRRAKNWDYANVLDDGYLDLDDLKSKVEKYKDKLKLVAITGASNVSGVVNPYHDICEIAHKYGAKILIDAAQLSPHRQIEMLSKSDPRHIDYLVMSAHKLYAPYGTGALICLNDFCDYGDPEFVGGGMAKAVSFEKVHYHSLPDREEAGSPNVIGAVAFACSASVLMEIGMEEVARHETELIKYAFEKLEKIDNVEILVPRKSNECQDRLGVIAFNFKNMNYQLAASILNYEYGIGVRSGSFCTQPYVTRLLKLDEAQKKQYYSDLINDNKTEIPGAIRASFGVYTSQNEVDILVKAIEKIAHDEFEGKYTQNKTTGRYIPENYSFENSDFFSFKI